MLVEREGVKGSSCYQIVYFMLLIAIKLDEIIIELVTQLREPISEMTRKEKN